MCTELQPPGGYPIAVKYIISWYNQKTYQPTFSSSLQGQRPTRPSIQSSVRNLRLGRYFRHAESGSCYSAGGNDVSQQLLPVQKHLPSTHCRNLFATVPKTYVLGNGVFHWLVMHSNRYWSPPPNNTHLFSLLFAPLFHPASYTVLVDCVWNVMAHAQKPDFVFRRNGRVHLNRQGLHFSRLLAIEVCASAVVMLDTPCSERVWRVLATHSIRQFPLHSPPPSPPPVRHRVPSHFNCTLLFLCLRCVGNTPAFLSCGNILPKRQVCATLQAKFKVLYISALICYHLPLH
jgi:hypothetical protein